jgi:hypothetical protein
MILEVLAVRTYSRRRRLTVRMYVLDLHAPSLGENFDAWNLIRSSILLLLLLAEGIFFGASIHLIATTRRRKHRLRCPTSAMAATLPKIMFYRFAKDRNMVKGFKDARPSNLFPASLENPRPSFYRVLIFAGPV